MRRRLLVVGGIAATFTGVALSAGAASAYFWDSSRSDMIASGVSIAGVDVGGLHAADAQRLLGARLVARLRRPITVVHGGHRFLLRPARAGLNVDVAGMVAAAVGLSRQGTLADRVLRDVRGRQLDESVPLRAGVSTATLADFSRRVAKIVDTPAHSARIEPVSTATRLRVVPSRTGLAVKQPTLTRSLAAALLRTDGARTVAVPTRPVWPRWTTATLAKRYGTFILVSRETFTLRLYKRLKLVKTYHIAVGMAGLETPAGFYTIDDKQIDPWWHVPLSAWAGSLAGKVIPPGPDDPIKARWMGFYNGAGIHGTDETWSIGSAASHGCIRMTIPDVEDLYPRVPLHTPIYVG
jgi:hypothetical protein